MATLTALCLSHQTAHGRCMSIAKGGKVVMVGVLVLAGIRPSPRRRYEIVGSSCRSIADHIVCVVISPPRCQVDAPKRSLTYDRVEGIRASSSRLLRVSLGWCFVCCSPGANTRRRASAFTIIVAGGQQWSC